MPERYFAAVRGHGHARSVLARAVERDRVPPALLLTGREGTGRRLLALELAKALACKGPGDGPRPCGACSPCRRIDAGAHPDVTVVRPEEGKAVLGIDAVRALLDELALAPVEAPRRVFVLDPADALSDDAQNALLKALEEPPARAHLVLVASHEEALLRTIASRCFVLALGDLDPADVQAILEARGVPAAEARERAAWAAGSPGLALREGHLERVADARRLLEACASGVAARDPLGVAGELIARAAPKNAESQARRDGALAVIDLAARALRDALGLAARGAPATERLSGASPDLVAALARPGTDAVVRALEAVARAEDAIQRNQNVNLALEGVVLDVASALCTRAPSTGATMRG